MFVQIYHLEADANLRLHIYVAPRDIAAEYGCLAFQRFDLTDEHIYSCGLPSTVWAQETQNLPLFDMEVDVINGGQFITAIG